jgi:hypothetical protein
VDHDGQIELSGQLPVGPADALQAVFEATDATRRPDGPPARARRAETRS